MAIVQSKLVWVAGNGNARVDVTVTDDDGSNRYKDAIHYTAAEWAVTNDTDVDNAAISRHTNWKAAVAAASNYVRTEDDWDAAINALDTDLDQKADELDVTVNEADQAFPFPKNKWLGRVTALNSVITRITALRDAAQAKADSL